MKALSRNGLILVFIVLMLSACGGGGGEQPQNNGDDPANDPQASSQWDQMAWGQGTWK